MRTCILPNELSGSADGGDVLVLVVVVADALFRGFCLPRFSLLDRVRRIYSEDQLMK